MPDANLMTSKPLAPAPGSTGASTVPPSNAGKAMRANAVMSTLIMPLMMETSKMMRPNSDELVATLKAMADLARVFRDANKQLGQSEMKMMQSSLPAAQTLSPEQQLAMKQQQTKGKLETMAPAMAG